MGIFKRATKLQARLRLGISAPSGGGKSYTGLLIATELAQGGKIAAIDTERGSLSKYSKEFGFDVLELESFEPANYVKAIDAAQREGYDVILVDSLSHAWIGKGGALEMVDNAAMRNPRENRFTAWREVTPQHNALVEAMLQCKCHLIATMRAKTEYIMEEYTDQRGNKKTKPVKIGLAPVQRDGMEYEFDVMADMDADHNLIVSKTRCPALDGKVFHKPGADIARILLDWVTDGAPIPLDPSEHVDVVTGEITRPEPEPVPAGSQSRPDSPAPIEDKKELFAQCERLADEIGLTDFVKNEMKSKGFKSLKTCPIEELLMMREELEMRLTAIAESKAEHEDDVPFDMQSEAEPQQAELIAPNDDAAPEW